MADYQISPFAMSIIKGFEGYEPRPKWDYKQYSVGYGTRWTPGTPIGTPEEHETALGGEAGKVGQWLDANVKTPMSEPQKAALTSFGFNLGTGNLARLLPDINSGDWNRVATRMKSFNTAGGSVLPGLTDRRQKEAALLTGDTAMPQPSLTSMLFNNARGAIGGPPQSPQTGGALLPAQVPAEELTQPSGRYSKLGEALLAAAAQSQPTGWGSALNSLGDLALGYTLTERGDKAKQEYQAKLAKRLAGANTGDALTQTLIASGDPELMKTGVAAKMEAAKPKSQIGRYKATADGVIDTATGAYVARPSGGDGASGLGPVAEKERQKAVGKGVGEAQVNLPQAKKSGQYIVKSIDELLGDPDLSRVTGPWQGSSWSPNISGTANRVQSRIDQLQGQTFLQAFNALRGGGQITEAEGAKATAALNRLGTQKMSDADYRAAIIDFRNEVANLYDLAQAKAGMPPERRERISAHQTQTQSVPRPRAVNPQTGETIEFNPDSGQWEPIK
ncbi:MAG TPA: lysozyme [Acidiferrobacterales bacterium]|nr:lysozyme [Acidiferrobacterales bacterium]